MKENNKYGIISIIGFVLFVIGIAWLFPFSANNLDKYEWLFLFSIIIGLVGFFMFLIFGHFMIEKDKQHC